MSKNVKTKPAPHGRDAVADLAESIRVCDSRIQFYELASDPDRHAALVAEQQAVIAKAQQQIVALREQRDNAPRMLKELATLRERLLQDFLRAKNFHKVNQLTDLVAKAQQLAKELAEAQAAATAEKAD